MPLIRAAILGLAIGFGVRACNGSGEMEKVGDGVPPPTVEQNGVKLPPPTCMDKPVSEEERCDMI